MDNDGQKRARAIAQTLAAAVFVIRAILVNLDEIRLTLHPAGGDVRERISEDYLMVARDVLPGVDAPAGLLTLIRSVLVDWVVLSDLVAFSQARPAGLRLLETMEEVAGRLTTAISVIRDVAPELLEEIE